MNTVTDTSTMDFDCRNCGHEFQKQSDEDHRVQRRTSIQDTVITPEGYHQADDIEPVVCPNCGTKRDVVPQR